MAGIGFGLLPTYKTEREDDTVKTPNFMQAIKNHIRDDLRLIQVTKSTIPHIL
jgi:hypothetical protein